MGRVGCQFITSTARITKTFRGGSQNNIRNRKSNSSMGPRPSMYGEHAAWALFWHVKRVMWGPRFLLHASAFSSRLVPGLLPCRSIVQHPSFSQVLAVPLITLFSSTAALSACVFVATYTASSASRRRPPPSFAPFTASPPNAPSSPKVPPDLLLHRAAAAMVYITSDLFGPVDTHSQSHHHWHVMTDSHHDIPGLGKRKRSLDGDATHNIRGTRPQHNTSFERNSDHKYSPHAMDHRPVKQMKRLSPKIALVKSTSHLMDTDITSPASAYTSVEVQPHAVSDLRACHACKSAPKRKKELENYMDCNRCIGRTCYICARQCLGGCGKKICKECTAEVGQEGDSWCLDCLQREQYMK